MTKDIYIIDPLGSTDADDAFSVSTENGEDILYIFIADPTSHFEPFDETFNSIVEKCSTKYFYDKPPIHLFDENILSLSNLKTEHETVNCVCFKIYVDSPILKYKISFEKIKPNVILTYETAELNPFLQKALCISDKLFENRKSYAKALREYTIDYPRLKNDKWVLEKQSDTCIKLKQMIAEFAIVTNKIVGGELKDNIFRSCEQTDEFIKCKTGREVLDCIVKNGISAKYETAKNKHLLIDDALYTHFTSPLRRASDCITHFILKYSINGVDSPFDTKFLEKLASEFTENFKKDKKRHHKDTKYFTLLAINNLPKPIKCQFKFNSKFNGYTNLLLVKVNEFDIQMSIVFKNKAVDYDFAYNINTINVDGKFDNIIFPELNELH